MQAGGRTCWASGRRLAGRRRARGARGLGVPVRIVGRLVGSAGPVWVLVNLAQFCVSFFDPILTQYCS